MPENRTDREFKKYLRKANKYKLLVKNRIFDYLSNHSINTLTDLKKALSKSRIKLTDKGNFISKPIIKSIPESPVTTYIPKAINKNDKEMLDFLHSKKKFNLTDLKEYINWLCNKK